MQKKYTLKFFIFLNERSGTAIAEPKINTFLIKTIATVGKTATNILQPKRVQGVYKNVRTKFYYFLLPF